MEKLKLDLNALVVESFDIHDEHGERGTIHGQAQQTDPRICETNEMGCYAQTLGVTNCGTCEQTCVQTCLGQWTCAGWFTCAENLTCWRTCDVYGTGCEESCVGYNGCW